MRKRPQLSIHGAKTQSRAATMLLCDIIRRTSTEDSPPLSTSAEHPACLPGAGIFTGRSVKLDCFQALVQFHLEEQTAPLVSSLGSPVRGWTTRSSESQMGSGSQTSEWRVMSWIKSSGDVSRYVNVHRGRRKRADMIQSGSAAGHFHGVFNDLDKLLEQGAEG